MPIAAGVLLFAAALVFTSCSNGSDSGGGTPKHAVTFGVDGSPANGTIKAKVDGTEINSGDTVEQGKIVEFTATPDNPATHNVDFWSIDAGTFEAGTGASESTIAKIKVVQPVTVTVKFKPVGTPPTKYNVTFGVSGTGGTLKATVDGSEIHSPAQVEKNKRIDFTAEAALGYAVEKWTNSGNPIAGETNATYEHTVTEDADIAVHFKTAPVDVYVTGTSGGKAYVWKNGAPTQLSAHKAAPDKVAPYAVHAQVKDVYIVGEEIAGGVGRPLVWKKDGSLHWISKYRWSDAYDITFYKGKTFVAGKMYDFTDEGASITDISDPENPTVTFLCKKTPQMSAHARALCAGTGKLYAAGHKRDSDTLKDTVFLWTKPDAGTVSELELGLVGTYTDIPYGVCTAGSSVYVAARKLWKVEGTTVTPITVSGANGVYALCVCNGTVYAAGQTNGEAAVWKIEGINASLHKKLSTSGGVYALCAGRDDLYAAGFYRDTDNKEKPVWWHIAADLAVTEHKLGTAEGEALGICVAPQE